MKPQQNKDPEREELPRPIFKSWYVDEPMLIFGNGQKSADQKTGLTTYGPCKLPDQKSDAPSTIKIGIIGTTETIHLAERLIEKAINKVQSNNEEPFLRPPFPGFKSVFNSDIMLSEQWKISISEDEISNALKGTFETIVSNVTDLFSNALKRINEREPRPTIVLYALTQDIVNYCGTRGFGTNATRTKMTKEEKKIGKIVKKLETKKQTMLIPFDPSLYNPDLLPEASNLRRLMKARSMEIGIPIQILKYRTLIEKDTQDSPTLLWNLCTALYYKAGGYLWRMADSMPGTCYVGISFFKNKIKNDGRMRTSLAQIFTHTGEGLVLRGDDFEWDEKQGKSPHLSEDGARNLLAKAINRYKEQMAGQPPSRIVVHKTSKFWPAELKGFKDAVGSIRYDFIAFGKRGFRFLRYGNYPPLRGTIIQTNPKNYFLFTKGFVPYLHTYPGLRVPLPLEVIEHHGDGATPTTIAKEILALTKMNWNTADFSTAFPITIEFATSVGDILAVLPEEIKDPRPQYYYYM